MKLLLMLLLASGLAYGQIPPGAATYKRTAIAAWRSVCGLDCPIATYAAQVHQESSWNAGAISRTGAFGLTQFMPGTAKDIQARYGKEFGDLLMGNPVWQFKAQALYMRDIEKGMSGVNDCERMAFAMQGYNSGPGWVNKRKKLSPTPLVCFNATCKINPGVLPANQKEAEEYPVRILKTVEPRYVENLWGKGSCN